jgi:hypothetical protein
MGERCQASAKRVGPCSCPDSRHDGDWRGKSNKLWAVEHAARQCFQWLAASWTPPCAAPPASPEARCRKFRSIQVKHEHFAQRILRRNIGAKTRPCSAEPCSAEALPIEPQKPPHPSPSPVNGRGASSAEPCSAEDFPVKPQQPTPPRPSPWPAAKGREPSVVPSHARQERSRQCPESPLPLAYGRREGARRSAEPCSAEDFPVKPQQPTPPRPSPWPAAKGREQGHIAKQHASNLWLC